MKKYGLISIVVIIVVLMLYSAFRGIFPQIKDDNPVEEFLETIIEKQTGIDFDLSPLSKEE